MGRTTSAALLVLAFLALPAVAGSADRLLKQGDRFYENRGRGTQWCEKAIEAYEKVLAVEPNNVEASWKIARTCYHLGCHAEGDEAKLVLFTKGIDVAKRAISIDEKSVESHFWLGVSYGKYGEVKGIMNSLSLVDPIKEEMEKVNAIDETYEWGGGHRVLGRLYHKLPGAVGGSNEKSIEHLKRAVEIGGANLLNHIFLAEVYLDEGRKDEAKQVLQHVIDAPFQEERRSENEEEKAQAAELLETLE
jgi:tetratricopeptide (TPR) repeat protein